MVEVEGSRIVSQMRLPLSNTSEQNSSQQSGTGGAQASQSQRVEVIKDALKENKIKAKKALLGLSAQDQFIRSFQMPILNKSEIKMGVQFEVKKYIPFRTEDLVFDFQRRINKKSGKMDILFVAAIRNSFDTLLASLQEAGLAVAAVEPASLALLRILSVTGQLDDTVSFALVVAQGLEVEVTIIDKGFPCFSRETKLPEEAGVDTALFRGRLANEIRVSLDYYRRQFAVTTIDKILFLSKNLLFSEQLIPGLSEDLAVKVERVELEKDNEINSVQDLDMLKAYALALKDAVSVNFKIDLTQRRQAKPVVPEVPVYEKAIAFDINTIKLPVGLALLLIAAAYIAPQLRISESTAKLTQLQKKVRELFPPALKELSLDAINKEKKKSSHGIATLEKIIKNKSNLTSLFNILSYKISEGLWLERIQMTVKNNRQFLQIKGSVYSDDPQSAPETVNAFYSKLKKHENFAGLKLLPVSEAQKDKYFVTTFEISGEFKL